MSVSKNILFLSLQKALPSELVLNLIEEYLHIKQQFLLRKWRPTELSSGRFGECVLRIIEYSDKSTFTPFGTQIKSETVIKSAENNISLDESIRLIIPRLVRVILDFRNKRDVAHVGGQVNPNEQDSLLVSHSSDWIMAEIVRRFHSVSISDASKIIKSILELKIPVINEFEGYIKILDTKLNSKEKTLLLLYYKQPESISDSQLCEWVQYKSLTNYKSKILKLLDKEALIHYTASRAFLTTKGSLYVENKIDIEKISI